jgi:hypothetical protein
MATLKARRPGLVHGMDMLDTTATTPATHYQSFFGSWYRNGSVAVGCTGMTLRGSG